MARVPAAAPRPFAFQRSSSPPGGFGTTGAPDTFGNGEFLREYHDWGDRVAPSGVFLDTHTTVVEVISAISLEGHRRRTVNRRETQSTRHLVTAALEEDSTCRRPGVTSGVYRLCDGLERFTRLGHGMPTIRRVDRFGADAHRFDRAADDGVFHGRLKRLAPPLAAFDFARHGLFLAGGAASGILMHEWNRADPSGRMWFHDFDLFPVGHASDEAALQAISALGDHLYAWFAGRSRRLDVYRTQNCVTFFGRAVSHGESRGDEPRDRDADGKAEIGPSAEDAERAEGAEDAEDVELTGGGASFHPPYGGGDLIVQVILRRYSTIGEVIHGFDMGSSAVLWDGHHVYMTALGKVAAEHGANILNLVARRSSYEKRLARYFERGYDLVLPDLDPCSLALADGRLPYLYARQFDGKSSRGCGCALTASALVATRPGYNDEGLRADPEGEHEDGVAQLPDSDYAVGQVAYGNPRGILTHNIRILADPRLRVGGLCAYAEYAPGLDITRIEPFPDPVIMATVARWSFGCGPGQYGRVATNTLTSLLGRGPAQELVMAHMETGRAPPDDHIERLCAERAFALLPKARIPFGFMTVEDKTALTGPFPRAELSPREWYGECTTPRD